MLKLYKGDLKVQIEIYTIGLLLNHFFTVL
jgi:hypothetical protein